MTDEELKALAEKWSSSAEPRSEEEAILLALRELEGVHEKELAEERAVSEHARVGIQAYCDSENAMRAERDQFRSDAHHWEEMATNERESADAYKREADQLRARLEEAERLMSSIFKTRNGECRFCGSMRVYWNGNTEHSNLCPYGAFLAPNPPALTGAAFLPTEANPPEPSTCYDVQCRYYGQRHATAHEPKDAPEPRRHAFDDNGYGPAETHCWAETLEDGRCGKRPKDPVHE